MDEIDDGAQFAVITDDTLDSLRRMIGVPITDTVEPWCYEATRTTSATTPTGSETTIRCGVIRTTPPPAPTARSSLHRASCSRPAESSPATSEACPAYTPCGRAPTSPGTCPSRVEPSSSSQRHLRIWSSTTLRSPGERSSRSTTWTSGRPTARSCATETPGASEPSGTSLARRGRSMTRRGDEARRRTPMTILRRFGACTRRRPCAVV